jgi:hypothetical protein
MFTNELQSELRRSVGLGAVERRRSILLATSQELQRTMPQPRSCPGNVELIFEPKADGAYFKGIC